MHGEKDEEFRITLDNPTGVLHEVLHEARQSTRIGPAGATRRSRGTSGASSTGPASGGWRTTSARRSRRRTRSTSTRSPRSSASTASRTRSRTSSGAAGSASAARACRRSTSSSRAARRRWRTTSILSMKQGNVAAPSRVVDDDAISEYFEHQGHRTAVSQRALQAHADPWLGWTELRGVGQVVAELSPYEADLDWGALTEADEILPLLCDLGRATAKVHCVSDAGQRPDARDFQTEEAIANVIDGREDEFIEDLAAFGARLRLARPRRLPATSSTRSATARSRACRRLRWVGLGGDGGAAVSAQRRAAGAARTPRPAAQRPALAAGAGAVPGARGGGGAGAGGARGRRPPGWSTGQAAAVVAALFVVPALRSALVRAPSGGGRGDRVGVRVPRGPARVGRRRRLRRAGLGP